MLCELVRKVVHSLERTLVQHGIMSVLHFNILHAPLSRSVSCQCSLQQSTNQRNAVKQYKLLAYYNTFIRPIMTMSR